MIHDNVQNVAENYHSDNGKHQMLKNESYMIPNTYKLDHVTIRTA